jgi:LuxR family transcriptional regulator, maltose regulon positive regulatory protein
VKIYETKIMPPRLHRVVPRERLFHLLDTLSDYPVTWISSPAGSGKTTLVASYVRNRSIPALWYRADETDGDVAGFFYHLGEAAKRLGRQRTKPLPHFTPEYRTGISAFTRHYFGALFRKMRAPAVIVFDNYQDVPENAELHDVLRNGLEFVPEGIRVFVISRKEHPLPFVSLKAKSMLSSVSWEDMRFTEDEIREIMFSRKKEVASAALVRRIHEETQGWVAAVVLMLEGGMLPNITPTSIGHSSVFEYFTVEVFQFLTNRIKDFLLMTAILPSIISEIASELTGMSESEVILNHLRSNNCFTDRYGDAYHYHPLFREFLLDAARKKYSPEDLASLTVRAGQILARSRRTEDAVRLLLQSGGASEALPLILNHAETLLSQGRGATLEKWAGGLSETTRENTPWLLYWLGMGRLLTSPTDARRYLEKAFRLFEEGDHVTGSQVSVAGIINSIRLEWDDYRLLDPWIEWIDRHVDVHTPLPVPEVELQVASAMVAGLTRRTFWHPQIGVWVARTLAASREVKDAGTRLAAKGHVISYYVFLGHWAEMRLVADEIRQTTVSSRASPLVHLEQLNRVIETHDWVGGSWEETYSRLREALRLAEDMGVSAHLGMALIQGAYISCEMRNLQLAGEFLQRVEKSAFSKRKVGRTFYHSIASLFYLQKSGTILARQNADLAVEASIQAGIPILEAWCRVALAYALRQQGEVDAARDQLAMAERIVGPAGATHVLYLIRLTEASLFLDEGDGSRAAQALEEAFRTGREKGYGMTLFWHWQPEEMARLCAEALAHGIEEAYAREVITKHRLVPIGPAERLKAWAWPCRIRTLGNFEILVNGLPLTFTRKVQKKPLALLKALIAFGGKEVREDAIEDLLWPDAEGDMAHIASKTTLSRLRRLLGGDHLIEVREGKVSLNGRLIWLDTWAMESLVKGVSELWRDDGNGKTVGKAEEFASLIVDLYRGEFLSGEDPEWVGAYRDRLKSRVDKTIERLISTLSKAGEHKKAKMLNEHRSHEA